MAAADARDDPATSVPGSRPLVPQPPGSWALLNPLPERAFDLSLFMSSVVTSGRSADLR